ncbi:hypothetical protein AAHA92_09429 [Salvia divinorum]|uniref:Uncharacterized protein n=1 Tax=Salvia divinorum TaxID=28513 RepID=A0ABD1HSU2_SALDI
MLVLHEIEFGSACSRQPDARTEVASPLSNRSHCHHSAQPFAVARSSPLTVRQPQHSSKDHGGRRECNSERRLETHSYAGCEG